LIYGNDSGQVVARKAEDGRLLWEHDLPKGLSTTPVVHDGLIWVGSTSASLYALDLETGARRWALDALVRLSGFNAPVVLAHGRLYAMSNAGRLYGFGSERRKTWVFDSSWDKQTPSK
jgi:outer membrane protein assembly factor BamB